MHSFLLSLTMLPVYLTSFNGSCEIYVLGIIELAPKVGPAPFDGMGKFWET